MVALSARRAARWRAWSPAHCRFASPPWPAPSFAMAQGETFASSAECGSGKTTLARAIIGLVAVHSGSVLFEGRSTLGLAGAALKRAAPRHRHDLPGSRCGSLSPRFTVRGLLAEPFRIHGLADRDLDAEVERLLRPGRIARAMLDRLSASAVGGQARRVGVARALALAPKLVIADEPTAGLDVSVQGEVLNLLNDLQATPRPLHADHHPQSERGAPCRRPHGDHVSRPLRRGRADRGASSPAPAIPIGWRCSPPIPSPIPMPRPNRVALEGEVPSLLDRPLGCEFHGRCPFVQERCRSEAPAVSTDPDGRLFTCHYPLTPGSAHPEVASTGGMPHVAEERPDLR